MSRSGFRFSSLAFALTLLPICLNASLAQTVTEVYDFDGIAGAQPENVQLIQGQDGQLYGSTAFGGTNGVGAIFKITPAGHATLLHSFNGTEGENPYAGLTLGVDGNFYGTALIGGPAGAGVLFRMTPAGAFTVLHNFMDNDTDGGSPSSPPILAADGNFYGTAQLGGPTANGVVYKYVPGEALTIIYNFQGPDGAAPLFYPTQGGYCSLYVPAYEVGNGQCGTIVKMSTSGIASNTFTFDCARGRNPFGPLYQAPDGSLYGAAQAGGVNSQGVLFKLSQNFDYSVLHNFGATVNDGADPGGGVIQATDGKLYGVAFRGGAPEAGTIYSYAAAGIGRYNTIFTFQNRNTSDGKFGQHTNGLLSGVTTDGGANGSGTVYSLNVGLGPFVALVRYQGRIGSTVQILGQGFTGTTSVTLNGVGASFTVVRDTYLTAVVPAGATSGPVVATTPAGTLKSNKNFRVNP